MGTASQAGEAIAGGSVIVFILCLILAIAWIVLPFAIVGTKGILRQLLAEQRRANKTLEKIAKTAEDQRKLLSVMVDLQASAGIVTQPPAPPDAPR